MTHEVVRARSAQRLVPAALVRRGLRDHRAAGAIADVEYRAGDWLYRAPADLARQLADMERAGGSPRWRTQRRAMISTLAYNRATGERLEVAATATADDQATRLRSN